MKKKVVSKVGTTMVVVMVAAKLAAGRRVGRAPVARASLCYTTAGSVAMVLQCSGGVHALFPGLSSQCWLTHTYFSKKNLNKNWYTRLLYNIIVVSFECIQRAAIVIRPFLAS